MTDSPQAVPVKNPELSSMHLLYLSSILIEGIRNFTQDLIDNSDCAPVIVARKSYIRMVELSDNFEKAALLSSH